MSMLAELLRALAEDRSRTIPELAGELGTDTHKLRLAFEHCQRLGYLECSDVGCETTVCETCRLRCGFNASARANDDRREPMGPVWWRVTERGLGVVRSSARQAGAPT